jgi:hypothetical protein
MKLTISKLVLFLVLGLFAQFATADVSGNWVFAVTLGDLGSGNATISLNQEAEGKITGTYSGQLANGPIEGSYEGDDFNFSFGSDALGSDITYSGSLRADGTVAGTVSAQGQEMGTFTGNKQ